MKSSKRNPAIEFIRLLACLIVVACHVNFYLRSSADTEAVRTFFFCLFSDGVSIFFLITGCFLFQNERLSLFERLSRLWKRTAVKILFPAAALFFVCLALSSWQLPVKYFDHAWYIFVYTAVILAYPLLNKIVVFLDRGRFRDLAFLAVSLLLLIQNDLAQNRLLFFGFSPLTGFLPACILVLWGHILYRRLHGTDLRLFGPFLLTGAALSFILLNLLRAFAQLSLYASGSEYNLRVWHTSFGLLASVCVLLPALLWSSDDSNSNDSDFARAFSSAKPAPEKQPSAFLRRLVCRLASYSFGIYLIHPLLSALALHFDLWDRLQTFLFARLPYLPGAVCFLVAGTLGLFLVSLSLCFLLRSVLSALRSVHTRFPDEA